MNDFLKLLREQAERYAVLEEQVALEAMRKAGRSPDPTLLAARVEALGASESARSVTLARLPKALAEKTRLACAAQAPLRLSHAEFKAIQSAGEPLAPGAERSAPLAVFRLPPT